MVQPAPESRHSGGRDRLSGKLYDDLWTSDDRPWIATSTTLLPDSSLRRQHTTGGSTADNDLQSLTTSTGPEQASTFRLGGTTMVDPDMDPVIREGLGHSEADGTA